jgi:hypothetical protein
MYAQNELLFPHYVIASLRNDRGYQWQELVDSVIRLQETDPETLAFSLMMIRMNRCLSCETDSYRAMRGCKVCSHQALRRYNGSEDELILCYQKALEDVREHLDGLPENQPTKKRVVPARAA